MEIDKISTASDSTPIHTRVYNTDVASDILGIPYFWAAINVNALEAETYEAVVDFLLTPYTPSKAVGVTSEDFAAPEIHFIGAQNYQAQYPRHFNYRTQFFNDSKEIRHSILAARYK